MLRLTPNPVLDAASHLFVRIAAAPAVQSLAQRLEKGGVLPVQGISPAAQPFFAVLLHHLFPQRPIVVVTDSLRSQETFQQDIETWLAQLNRESKVERRELKGGNSRTSTLDPRPLFFPPWETLPHEARLPHVDVISDRLDTLVSLAGGSSDASCHAKVVVTSVTALLQRTFSAATLRSPHPEPRRPDRPARSGRMAGGAGLRARSPGYSERGNCLTRRHPRRFPAHQSVAGPNGILWR